MHVCLLTSGRIFEAFHGGEEKFTLSLAEWLFNQDIDVTIMGSTFLNVKAKTLSRENAAVISTMPSKGRTLHPPYFVYMLSRLALSLFWTLKIWSLHRSVPITMIHAQDTGYAGLAAIITGKLLRIPVVLSSHGIRHRTLAQSMKGKLTKFLLKFEYQLDIFNLRKADAVVVVSGNIKTYFERIVSREIKVIPVPIRVKDFQFSESDRISIRKELGIPNDQTIVGYVGRLAPEKNLPTLLSSFMDALNYVNSIKLVLVGSGPSETELKKYVDHNKADNDIRFCGARRDVSRVLSGFDIFVLPSYIEGQSTALLEAMASGRAIICSDIAANRELLSDNDATFFDPSNVKDLSNGIQLLCTDEHLRAERGKNCRIKAITFDENEVFPSLLKYYNQVSQKGQQGIDIH